MCDVIRTANRKCTVPKLSSRASYSGGSGSWRLQVVTFSVADS